LPTPDDSANFFGAAGASRMISTSSRSTGGTGCAFPAWALMSRSFSSSTVAICSVA